MSSDTLWVVVGAGYTGQRLARELSRAGNDVVVTRRSAERAAEVAAGIGARVRSARVDLDDVASLEAALRPGAVVVDSVPPSGDVRQEQELVHACAKVGVFRLVYLSSTGVYPSAGGGRVTEETATRPFGSRGERRLEAERAILGRARELGVSAVALRIAGIYGPGRGVPARMAAGSYRVIGAGSSLVSRIHVDDLVTVIIAAGQAPSLPFDIINVADDEPTSSRFLADRVAEMLQVPPAPTVDPDTVSEDARAMLGADRHIVNDRLKALGVELRYPSWREGVAAVIAEMKG